MGNLRRKRAYGSVLVILAVGVFASTFNACTKSSFQLGDMTNDQASSSADPITNPNPNPTEANSKDAFSLIQAENMDGQSGGSTDATSTGIPGVVGGLNDGNYLKYSQINFGNGALSVTMNLGVADSFEGRTIEFRQDSPTGPLLGSLITQSTGGWQTIKAQNANLSKVSDLHDLYLVMKGDSVANIDSFIFAKSSNSTPTPQPTPNPMPAPDATITIDEMIKDANSTTQEQPLIANDFDWEKSPKYAVDNYSPKGSLLPSWWTGIRPTNADTILSWHQIFEGVGNAAKNTRVAVKNLRVYVLSHKTRKWTLMDNVQRPGTETWHRPFNNPGPSDGRNEADGSVSFKPVDPNFRHGYGGKSFRIDPLDIRAVSAVMDFRLVKDNASGVDDRSQARYGINCGADWYKSGQDWGTGGVAPAIGNGRFKQGRNEWRSCSILVPNYDMGTTFDELRTNPPPIAQ